MDTVNEKRQPKVVSAKLELAEDVSDLSIFKFVARGSACAHLLMGDGSEENFYWYHDEITYVAEDFVGKTMKEIGQMHYERDLAYLRS